MADSDDDNDKDYEQGLNMTGFLFGNIDENGQLEDDVLDASAKQHLASLGQLGLNSLLREMMPEDDDRDTKSDDDDERDKNGTKEDDYDTKDDANDNVDYMNKSPTAEDFSDINELAEDLNEPLEDKCK